MRWFFSPEQLGHDAEVEIWAGAPGPATEVPARALPDLGINARAWLRGFLGLDAGLPGPQDMTLDRPAVPRRAGMKGAS